MTSIGMLHYRKDPEHVKKAYAYAAVAMMEGIDFFYFSYHGVDFEQDMISGWNYNNGSWKQVMKPFPDVVINHSSPKTKNQSLIRKRLKEKVVFTSHSVGGKMKVYRKLAKDGKFASYLIPSVSIKETNELLAFMEKHHRVVLKPVRGNHGKQVLFLERQEQFFIKNGEEIASYDENEFTNQIDRLLKARKWLVQPFICCVTKVGLTYDFRLHMQKNGEGEWEITLIYPRISGSGKRTSNISSGGYRGEFLPFLMAEFPDSWILVKEKLEQFALEFTPHFEGLYRHDFDELGIDLGLDENGKLWLFEVNWRPGSKHRELEVAKRLIPYCRYLAEKNKEHE